MQNGLQCFLNDATNEKIYAKNIECCFLFSAIRVIILRLFKGYLYHAQI